MSQRSLVIGFKVIITTPDGLPEWEERMNVCYGKSNRSGFEALKDFDHNYRQISIPKLAEIRQKYDAEYAFLYLETPSLNLPVLFQNRHYKLVDLRPLDKISDVSSENKNTQTN